MPTYQYACTACGHELEAVQSFSDDPLTQCPACEGRLRKLFSAVGIVFKGSGFYRNDSRSDKSNSASTTESSARDSSSKDSPSKDSSSKDSSSAPATASDSTSPSSTSSGTKPAKGTPAKSGATAAA